MQSNKYFLLAAEKRNKIWAIFVCVSFFAFTTAYTTTSNAFTNVLGIEIELIPTGSLDENPSLKSLEFDSTADNHLSNKEANHFNKQSPTPENLAEKDLWNRIKNNYAMPNTSSAYTKKRENWYASHPKHVARMMARSEKYLFYIVEEVEKRNMPSEIALLPMIESAYDPQAFSRSNAAGIWQFIPSTGRYYGLKQNWWIDNRRNIVASTTAALDYLQKLHAMFESWDLALAAYNAGEGTVGRAIARNKARNLPTDYQSLKLPAETQYYVPKLQAIKNIISQPERFGLEINSISNQAYFVKIAAPKQIDSKLAAELAGISHEEIIALNPSFNRPVIASKHQDHHLILPVASVEPFRTNLVNYDKPLSKWKTYNAKRGENISTISKRFKINATELKKINNLSRSSKIKENRPILVPNDSNKEANFLLANLDFKSNKQIRKKSRAIKYKVKKGDTISGIAKKFSIKSKQILKTNRLKSNKIKIGQLLKLTSSKSYVKKRISSKVK